MRKELAVAIWLVSALAAEANANPPQTRWAGRQPLGIIGLHRPVENECAKDRVALNGAIVARQFSSKLTVLLTGITLERPDGGRDFINLEYNPDQYDAMTNESTIKALQLLSRIGRVAHTRVYTCGASGRVMVLDELE